ncbi:aldo/keto reductase [Schaalia suimastitidis]|uniref:aldo/keto reductase n=1 Tax=Schaalia suimastitidis TaxID=121163 RepID=UPI00040542CC|nr:aldo/keto reductase [Schaalia suimastitidis]
MDIRRCGTSGLQVSALGLGTLTWGRDTPPHEAVDMARIFVDAGGSLVECAPWYGDGLAVDVMAETLANVGRHHVQIAWRGGMRRLPGDVAMPSAARGALLYALDEALSRMGTDYVDVCLAVPDQTAPVEETLGALEYILSTGRAHYVGLDGYSLWDTALAVGAASRGHIPTISVVEADFSLATTQRMSSYVDKVQGAGVGVFARSPLAAGVMTGKYRHSTPPDSRAASEHLQHTVAPYLTASSTIVEALAKAAHGLDRTMADVALAWVRDYPGVTSAIIGPRTLRQAEQLLELDAPLPEPIRDALTEVSLSPYQ